VIALLRIIAVAAISAPAAAGAGPARPGIDRAGVPAHFEHASYAPGELAVLRLSDDERAVRVSVHRAGLGPSRTRLDDELRGRPVAHGPVVRATGTVGIPVGDWPSGLYFARLAAPDGRVGHAPFVVRPPRPGTERVAVVLPTYTWQAYNFRDADGDGRGDTWYADARVHRVALRRPFLDRGVPPHYRGYDAGFVHWLVTSGRRADVLADEDLERVPTGDELARRYDLVVVPGHEEYVTGHVFDVVERYRDLGGNLLFLSANNFFYRVERRGDHLLGRSRWRDRGRPESRLLGVQYVDWNHDRWPNRDYVVVGADRAPWLFAGTGLRNGDRFGRFGIEIDARTTSSPRGTTVLARVPDVFGSGRSAEMTYYETPAGARVFSAGTINFGGSAWFPVPRRLLENLWTRLSAP
jgi:hypothetical protein